MNTLLLRPYPWNWDKASKIPLNATSTITFTGGNLLEAPQCALRLGDAKEGKNRVSVFTSQMAGKSVGTELYDLPLIRRTKGGAANPYHVPLGLLPEKGGAPERMDLELTGAVQKLPGSEQRVLKWLSFFDELIALNRSKTGGDIYTGDLEELIEEISGDASQPVYSLIVRISEELRKTLPGIMQAMRKILSADRTLMPVNRIAELDSYCIRWVVKQPGKTVYEKASANKFRLMGIARHEQYDLLENRVLKDFLIRCDHECLHYLQENQWKDRRRDHIARLNSVHQFQTLCEEALASPKFADVARQVSLPNPNYVLLSDNRYKAVWRYYKALVHKEREKDELWAWQHRTIGDVALLLLQNALVSLTRGTREEIPFVKGIVNVSHEQLSGERLRWNRSEQPYFYKNKAGCFTVIELVHVDPAEWGSIGRPFAANLGMLGTQNFLLMTSLADGGEASRLLVPVYSVNHAACMHSVADADRGAVADCSQSMERFSRYLREYENYEGLSLRALVFWSVRADEDDSALNQPLADKNAFMIKIPVIPGRWKEVSGNVENSLRRILEEGI